MPGKHFFHSYLSYYLTSFRDSYFPCFFLLLLYCISLYSLPPAYFPTNRLSPSLFFSLLPSLLRSSFPSLFIFFVFFFFLLIFLFSLYSSYHLLHLHLFLFLTMNLVWPSCLGKVEIDQVKILKILFIGKNINY